MPTPLSASSLGGLPIQIDATARDYASIRSELITLCNALTPEWTDFYEADPGVTLLEAMAYVGSVLSYTLDRIQNESYLITAQERTSVTHLLRLIGYELSSGSAASAPVAVVATAATTIPKGWQVSSKASAQSPAQTFELLEAVSLSKAGIWTTPDQQPLLKAQFPGQTINTNAGLVIVAGNSVNDELAGTSTGEADQKFSLDQKPLALNPDGSSPVKVLVNNKQWLKVSSFLGHESTAEVYTVQISPTGLVSIIFGDGVNGKIPDSSNAIVVSYRYGGGSIGNSIGTNSLTSGTAPNISDVWNPAQPSGGSDAETTTHAKKFGPLSLRALDRCVTLEDFETLAKLVPGGGIKAVKAAHTQSPWEVDVYIAAEGNNPSPTGAWFPELDTGTGFIGAVGRWLTQKKPVPTTLRVHAPEIIKPYLSAHITCISNFLQSDVKFEVQKNLVTLFQGLTQDFGKDVPVSKIIQVIENSRGVDWVQIQGCHRVPKPRFVRGNLSAHQYSLSTVTGIKPTCVADTYEIRWTSSSTYTLVGKKHGPITDASGQTQIFPAGVANDIDRFPIIQSDTVPDKIPLFTLNIALGIYDPNIGDQWSMKVDNYIGNLTAEPFDMIVATISSAGSLSPSEVALTYGGGIG